MSPGNIQEVVPYADFFLQAFLRGSGSGQIPVGRRRHWVGANMAESSRCVTTRPSCQNAVFLEECSILYARLQYSIIICCGATLSSGTTFTVGPERLLPASQQNSVLLGYCSPTRESERQGSERNPSSPSCGIYWYIYRYRWVFALLYTKCCIPRGIQNSHFIHLKVQESEMK